MGVRRGGYGPGVLPHASLLARGRLLLGRGTTLGSFLEQSAAVRGDRRLVEEAGGTTLTQAEAADRVDAFAGAIAPRVGPGDRVVVATANTYDQLLLCLAACRAGAVAVPVNPLMRDEEVAHVVEDAGADVVLRDADELSPTPLGEDRSGDVGSTAMLFYTSGTTGRPKGVAVSHRGLLGPLTAGALWPGYGREDEAVVGLPIAHVMGFITLVGLAAAGIPVWFLERFKADAALDAIETRRSSVFVGVPAM
jgi:acyl-CoA synthetase (AMP-forming)/AMP-acid ligase II